MLIQPPSGEDVINWLAEYARPGEVEWHDDNRFTLRNIRDFRYSPTGQESPAWYQRQRDLSQLTTTALVLSYWGGGCVAHAFLSFGFRDGQWLAISVETRRRHNQPWSSLGGLWRNYPLMYVVADERDVIGVRLHIRRERVYLYSLNITPQQSQQLLRDYLLRIEQLNNHPEWYHTLLNNCTTNILRHGRAVSPAIKYHWRLLLSGFADRYCYQMGLLDTRQPFATLRARSRLMAAHSVIDSPSFSQDIRRGAPAE